MFGPVTCVYRYSDLEEAIAIANSLPFAFQASIFAQDLDVALHAADRLAASAVMVNDSTAFRTDWMPFAGRRQSGYGVGGIPYTMREMTQEKMIVLRRSPDRAARLSGGRLGRRWDTWVRGELGQYEIQDRSIA